MDAVEIKACAAAVLEVLLLRKYGMEAVAAVRMTSSATRTVSAFISPKAPPMIYKTFASASCMNGTDNTSCLATNSAYVTTTSALLSPLLLQLLQSFPVFSAGKDGGGSGGSSEPRRSNRNRKKLWLLLLLLLDLLIHSRSCTPPEWKRPNLTDQSTAR